MKCKATSCLFHCCLLWLVEVVVAHEEREECGFESLPPKQKEIQMNGIERWKIRYAAKKENLPENWRLLQNTGVDCVQCVNIDTYFHFLKDPAEPSGSRYGVSEADLQDQITALVEGFAETPFTFTFMGLSTTPNQRWARLAASNDNDLVREVGRELRVGGPDVLNVYFSDGTCNSINGFAFPPFDHGIFPINTYDPIDSVWICTDSLNGGSLVHEVGHWFGLEHVFLGNSCSESNPNDFVDDTPQMRSRTFGCPEQRDSCPNRPGLDPIHNHMDYSTCRQEFTPGQMELMYGSMDTFRRDLEPIGCNPVAEATISLDFLMDDKPTEKGFALYELIQGQVLAHMGNANLIDFSNKRLQSTVCVDRTIPHELQIVDFAGNGFEAPSYMSLVVNGVEAVRGYTGSNTFHTFSADQSDCDSLSSERRIALKLFTDESPQEILWSLEDSINDLLIADHKLGGDGPLTTNTLFVDRCVSLGEYKFTIEDSAGNGIASPGFYQLLVNGEVMHTGGGNGGYKDSESILLTITESGVDVTVLSDTTSPITPAPTTPAPVTPAPTTPVPTTSAPLAPIPTTGTPATRTPVTFSPIGMSTAFPSMESSVFEKSLRRGGPLKTSKLQNLRFTDD